MPSSGVVIGVRYDRMTMKRTIDPARFFHDATNMDGTGAFEHRDALVDYRRDPENTPITFKEYEGAPRVDLPAEALRVQGPRATQVLSRGLTQPQALDFDRLARVLAYSAGITRTIERGGRMRYFRAASSAHSYPDLYVVCGDLPGLSAGVYYFHGLKLQLARLRDGDHRAVLAAALADPNVAARPASIVITGIPWRACFHYRERGLRHVYWDTGGLLANQVTEAEAWGVEARVYLGFDDQQVAGLVGADQEQEFPVAVLSLGAAGTSSARPLQPQPVAFPAQAIATREPVLFPKVLEAHCAGDLEGTEAVRQWRAGAAPAAAARFPFPLEASTIGDASMEEVFLMRGSSRRMRPDSVPEDALIWALGVTARGMPGDWVADGSGLLDHHVLVYAVDGHEPGLYRFRPEGIEQTKPGDFRDAGRQISMRQGQGGDGAYLTFHLADLDRIHAALGPRGYRAAQVEAGWVLERLHLATFALGVGCTGLTFFDREVMDVLDTQLPVMSEVAVGMPAYRPAKGGLGKEATRIEGRAFDLLFERMKELAQS
jgi:SagB-type dehydrogenase family enzyme